MKNTKFLSAIMAITVMFGAVGCGSADRSESNGGAYDPSPRLKSEGTAAAREEAAADDVVKGAEAEADFEGELMTEELMTADAEMADGDVAAKGEDAGELADEPAENGEPEPDQLPEAGQLTAAEWNDNANWGFFTNLVNTQLISFPSYGIDPRFRTAVTVTNADGAAVPNAKVKLLDEKGNVLWSAVADKNGAAYLFGQGGVNVEVTSGDKTQTFEVKSSGGNEQSGEMSGSSEVTAVMEDSGKLYKETEIMFIVDTTGSMGDEMLFLQSEFSAITKAVGTENIKYSVNFYRDEGDDYVVKTNPFTTDIGELQKLINAESADGGGDLPEAVAEALDESIVNMQWSDETVKLAFLIFDAPPHEEKADMVAAAAKAAAEKGVRIIPVVSSNAQRETELFGRAAAAVTGGTYVFLTDDSGIGDSHLEPIIGDYEVEKLYDLIIRVINDYRQ